jgi:hypothetical protein
VARDDSVLLELPESDRQPFRGHVREQAPQLAEAARSGQKVANDQQRPAIADGLERARGETEVPVRGRHPLT